MDHSHNQHQHDHDNHSMHDSQEHDKHAGHSVKMFKDKFWISLFLSAPILIYSPMIQQWFSFSPPSFPGSQYIPFIFSTILFLYGGLVFLKSAVNEIKSRQPGMMTLISLAIITAYMYSVATLFFIKGDDFFWELATLIVIMLLGHWIEMSAISKAENALSDIASLLPDTAEKLIDNKPHTVLTSALQANDLILVRPGSNIPADGIIIHGTSFVNEAIITGESEAVKKSENDEVIGGTNNQDGALTVKVTKVGEGSTLSGIIHLISEAQKSKSNTQLLADKAAFILTVLAVLIALVTFITWVVLEDTGTALERSVTVLIIACPHALGLAIPLVVSISTALSARNGLLIRNRTALENARKLDWVLFDKTGTLTSGEHRVSSIHPVNGFTEQEILRLAGSIEQNSEHLIGRAIAREAIEKKISLEKTSDFSTLPGIGVSGVLSDGNTYQATSRQFVEENKLVVPAEILPISRNKTEVYLTKNGEIIGVITLEDALRNQSLDAINTLKSMGIKTAMITGDNHTVASCVAEKLGLDQFFAEVKPADKAEKVKELQKDGQKIAMVGDGVNDAPALTQADIGIAIGAGTDIAIKSADIILAKDSPLDVIKIVKLSKATYRKMIQNLVWATGYNVLAIPLAAGALAGSGVVISPAIGAVLMSLSTIIVAINAQLLRRTNLGNS